MGFYQRPAAYQNLIFIFGTAKLLLADMKLQRMDNVGIVVDDLEAAIAFFVELGLELEGKA